MSLWTLLKAEWNIFIPSWNYCWILILSTVLGMASNHGSYSISTHQLVISFIIYHLGVLFFLLIIMVVVVTSAYLCSLCLLSLFIFSLFFSAHLIANSRIAYFPIVAWAISCDSHLPNMTACRHALYALISLLLPTTLLAEYVLVESRKLNAKRLSCCLVLSGGLISAGAINIILFLCFFSWRIDGSLALFFWSLINSRFGSWSWYLHWSETQ